MYPSDHAYPADLPLWQLNEHQLTAGERVEATQYEQGEDRHREIRTFTPWMTTVNTTLNQEQFDSFAEWFETDIQGGSSLFDTQVAAMNGLLSQWWQARFLGPYRATAIHGGFHLVAAELILLDGPYDEDNLPPGSSPGDPPRVAPTIRGRGFREGQGTARFASSTLRGRSERDSELRAISTNTLRGRSERDSELTAQIGGGYILLESGDYLLTEDAANVLQE